MNECKRRNNTNFKLFASKYADGLSKYRHKVSGFLWVKITYRRSLSEYRLYYNHLKIHFCMFFEKKYIACEALQKCSMLLPQLDGGRKICNVKRSCSLHAHY